MIYKNNYNGIANYYSLFVRLVFGNKLNTVQLDAFEWIDDRGHLLFIGGGDGGILVELIKARPDLKITYVEASNKMISLTKKKLLKLDSKNIELICCKIEDFESELKFDQVLTFFFLDLYPQKSRIEVVRKIESLLNLKAKWIVCDFSLPKNLYQKLTEKVMFLFLKLFTKIESNQIEHYSPELKRIGFQENQCISFKKENLFRMLLRRT